MSAEGAGCPLALLALGRGRNGPAGGHFRLQEMATSPFGPWGFGSRGAFWLSLVAGCLLILWDFDLALKISKRFTDPHCFEAILGTKI